MKPIIKILMPITLIPAGVFAGTLQGNIQNAIDNMITILSVIMVGCIAWAGFELRRGDPQATNKLIYSIAGLITIHSADALIKFFS